MEPLQETISACMTADATLSMHAMSEMDLSPHISPVYFYFLSNFAEIEFGDTALKIDFQSPNSLHHGSNYRMV